MEPKSQSAGVRWWLSRRARVSWVSLSGRSGSCSARAILGKLVGSTLMTDRIGNTRSSDIFELAAGVVLLVLLPLPVAQDEFRRGADAGLPAGGRPL